MRIFIEMCLVVKIDAIHLAILENTDFGYEANINFKNGYSGDVNTVVDR